MTITNPTHIGKCWCGDKPTPDSVGDWGSADHYLRHGKSPHSRPLCSNTRILRLWDGDIGVRLHSTVVVVYPKPGWEYGAPGAVAWFTLGGHNTITTRNRITRFTPALVASNSHTPWPYLVHTDGSPRTPLNSNETVAVDKWGKMVGAVYDYPMDVHVHELARVPYVTTKAMPGGKKSATVHFEDEGKPGLYKNHYGPHTKPPAPSPEPTPSPHVDGNKVRHEMVACVPDMRKEVACPADCPGRTPWDPKRWSVDRMIVHLNDTHKWSREAIADWLESLDLDLELKERSTA